MNLFVIAAIILTGLAVATVVRPLLRKTGDTSGAPIAAVVLGLVLPAAVLLIYLYASNYDWSVPANNSAGVERGDGANSGTGMVGSIAEMATKLENRLRTEPDNVDGWLLLGRTYAQLQQVTESRRAYRQAMALEASTEAKLGVAEADIMIDQGNLMSDAGRLVEEVLAVEPDNPKALFYGGMVAMSHNDVDLFRDRWQRLLTMSPPDEIRAVIEAQLAQIGVGNAGAEKADIGSGPAISPEQNPATDPGIDISVSLSDTLAKRIKPGAVLYLVARDPNRRGPPLAVVRNDVASFPLKLNISDANAMIPGQPMLTLPRLQLIARITNSGEPVAQPGDLFGETAWIANQNSGNSLSIVIDQVVN